MGDLINEWCNILHNINKHEGNWESSKSGLTNPRNVTTIGWLSNLNKLTQAKVQTKLLQRVNHLPYAVQSNNVLS